MWTGWETIDSKRRRVNGDDAVRMFSQGQKRARSDDADDDDDGDDGQTLKRVKTT